VSDTTRPHKGVETATDAKSRREFMRAVLTDLGVLERMLNEGRFERGVRRVGAEQEMFLTDAAYQPAPGALDMIARLKDPHFTTELGAFQLELNADPHELQGSGLRQLEQQLNALLEQTRRAASELSLHVVLAGILPTIRQSDLGMRNMVPSPRYLALSKAVAEMRGSHFEFSIKGLDELIIDHDSVMVEACNSSFQVHLQVDADSFASQYNLAQVLAGPLLSSAVNSPLLFGKRLWAETRIALFQQAVDTRSKTLHRRAAEARVNFGTRYVDRSILEIFKEDITHFRALVGADLDEDPSAVLEAGLAPQLKALRLHNGTIYRWNRACYGIIDGKPHLRIENRVLPSGPSVADEVANAAFWCGLMVELGRTVEDLPQRLDFDHARGNFYAAAREGLGANFTWLDGVELSAPALLDQLLPVAEAGLRRQGIEEHDVRRYLGIVEQRMRTARTGSRWLLSSLHAMKDRGSPTERSNALVAATIARQASLRPVSEWESARLDEVSPAEHGHLRVDQHMTTTLFTVHADDALDVLSNLMAWERIRHVPVEDQEHRLLGLVSYRAVQRFLNEVDAPKDATVAEVMKREVITVTPETPTLEALHLMREHRISYLPVLHEGRLVGIVTEEDFVKISSDLLALESGV
jgi:CBS domain-containing protein/gamma-glutamylcysteine synthetase